MMVRSHQFLLHHPGAPFASEAARKDLCELIFFAASLLGSLLFPPCSRTERDVDLDNAVVAHESACLGHDFSFCGRNGRFFSSSDILCKFFFHVIWILWFPFK